VQRKLEPVRAVDFRHMTEETHVPTLMLAMSMLVTSDATQVLKTGPSRAHGIYQQLLDSDVNASAATGKGPQQRAVLD
jgi:hypothetical protein